MGYHFDGSTNVRIRRLSAVGDFHIDRLGDFAVARECASLLLAVDFRSIVLDLEIAARADNEFGLDVVPVSGLKLGNQTGRLWLVVSLSAVLDPDVHVCLLVERDL